MATWNASTEAVPAQADAPSTLGTTARADRVNVRERMENEHTSYTTKGGTSGGSVAADFLHKAGSAKAYYEASAPTVRPDGSTALAAADAGRIWVDSAGKEAWVWDGSAFARIVPSASTTLLLSSAVVSGNVQTSTLTANVVTATTFIGGTGRGIKSIGASGNWTVPANVTRVKVRVVGAGGNGGTGAFSPPTPGYGGGGGAGGYTEGVYDLTAAEISTLTVAVVVGVPGSGTSSFGAHASATGGSAGSTGTGTTGAGGAGGLGVGGADAVNLYGPAGGRGDGLNSGGDGFFGQGGRPHYAGDGVGGAGTGAGSGGAGGSGLTGTSAGGAGADGIVIVEW